MRWVAGSSCCSPTKATSALAISASMASKSLNRLSPDLYTRCGTYPELICGDCWARATTAQTDKTIAADRKRHGILIIVVLIRFSSTRLGRCDVGAAAPALQKGQSRA